MLCVACSLRLQSGWSRETRRKWSAVEEASTVSQERGQLGRTWLLFLENDSGLGESVQRRSNLEKGHFLLCAGRGGKRKRGNLR